MAIVCFEGPSAVGKTTTARAVGISRSAEVIPEVAHLFERPIDAHANWYLERQIDRSRLAREHSADGDVILDGDPFQPLWYNWAYDFDGWHSLDQLESFYRPRIARNELAFPDFYVLFSATLETLRNRKHNDPERSRRHFERHLRLVEPQQRYFGAVEQLAPGLVMIASSESVDENVTAVVRALQSHRARRPADLDLFDGLVRWLRAGVA